MAGSSRWITHGTRRVYASPWFATERWGWEIPAGWTDDGEEPAEAARREVLEESGYRVATVEPLMTYTPMSGISSQVYRVFLARGAVLVGEPEVAEADRVEWVPVAEVAKLMVAGQMPDGPSVTALGFFLATR
ncbi:NUDIX domain-containing protein [Kutzneria sp. CA-103260]|uniref:NUDIX domain-containing protein n=1 Tax=Kutzneria sp. CA-103260 TaxID=2802641 RepID=UPI001BA58998|nr:NUDIX hydrolase [Kutzneria sp. CA-103260]QUQ67700.1 GntR family transcriptional regulator [Kutzneria sp. CA-103260]